MENKYLITQEQLETIEHYRNMFELNADYILDLCSGEKDDITYGFELGKIHSHLRDCYDKMIKLENLIRSQKHEVNFKKSVKISKYIDDEHFTISIRTDCPAEYWYHDHIGEEFLVTGCTYSDLREVEGFSNKEPSDCFKVMDGEKKGSIILKEHCNYIW
jgi:hypothetical protein